MKKYKLYKIQDYNSAQHTTTRTTQIIKERPSQSNIPIMILNGYTDKNVDNYQVAIEFADIIFRFKQFPGYQVKGNRGILAMRSNYFSVLFRNEQKFGNIKYNKTHQIIYEVDYDPNVFIIILKVLLYNDTVFMFRSIDNEIIDKGIDDITLFNIITTLHEMELNDFIPMFANTFINKTTNIKLLVDLNLYVSDTYDKHFIRIKELFKNCIHDVDIINELTKENIQLLLDVLDQDLVISNLSSIIFDVYPNLLNSMDINNIRNMWSIFYEKYGFNTMLEFCLKHVDPVVKNLNGKYVILYPIYNKHTKKLNIPLKQDMIIYNYHNNEFTQHVIRSIGTRNNGIVPESTTFSTFGVFTTSKNIKNDAHKKSKDNPKLPCLPDTTTYINNPRAAKFPSNKINPNINPIEFYYIPTHIKLHKLNN